MKILKALIFGATCLAAVLVSAQTKAPVKTMIAVSPTDGSLPIAPMATPPSVGVGVSSAPPQVSQVQSTSFEVTNKDKNLREVLARWSRIAGWVHNPEHWTIDRDLPISGTADASVFGTDFIAAARKLLASSELTDRPVQPCFYSNNVVRVVSKAELCDKSK